MARQYQVDQRPGPMPAIRSVGASVVFEFPETGPKGGTLTIRCDENGGVFASIIRVPDATE